MIETVNLDTEWRCIGNFIAVKNRLNELSNQRGVYFWLYKKERKRIVYIGTATGKIGFASRLNDELEQLKVGLAYIIKPNKKFYDIYHFLKYNPYDESTKNLKEHLSETIWIPSKQIDSNKFSEGWKSYVESDYLNNIDIYIRKISGENEAIYAKYLEAQLQIYFKKREGIGYYDRRRGIKKLQSWLGRPEIKFIDLLKYKFNISNGLEDIWSEIDRQIDNAKSINEQFYEALSK